MSKPTAMLNNHALCVLGMHRSGTSALTGVLDLLGVRLGATLSPAQIGVNDLGFWEHTRIVRAHESLLRAIDSSWDDVRPIAAEIWSSDAIAPHRARLVEILRHDFGAAKVWGVKDPRMCRTLPLWLDIFAELGVTPHFLHIARHPGEVQRSLAKRNGFGAEKSAAVWLEHNLSAETMTRDHPRAFITFDALLADPVAVLHRVERDLTLPWPNPIEQVADRIAGFISPDHRHHAGAIDISGEPGPIGLAERVYRLFAAATNGDVDRDAIAMLAAENDRRVAAYHPELVQHLADTDRERVRLKRKVYAFYHSWSWKAAKPIRMMERLFGG